MMARHEPTGGKGGRMRAKILFSNLFVLLFCHADRSALAQLGKTGEIGAFGGFSMAKCNGARQANEFTIGAAYVIK